MIPKKRVAMLGVSLLLAFAVFADSPLDSETFCTGSQNERVYELQKVFFGGNLDDKCATLRDARPMADEAAPLFTDAINFVSGFYPLLQDSPAMVDLALLSAECSPYAIGDVSAQLCSLFKNTSVRPLQVAILTVLPQLSFFVQEFPAVLNVFAQNLLEDGLSAQAEEEAVPFDEDVAVAEIEIETETEPPDEGGEDAAGTGLYDTELMRLTLAALSVMHDPSSFEVYFSYYAANDSETGLPDDLRAIAESYFTTQENDYTHELRSLLESGDVHTSRMALELVLSDEKKSDFFKAETAETALENAILIAEDAGEFSNEEVLLQIRALKELRRTKWTRSSSLVVRYFAIACTEFENGLMTEDDFISVIQGVQELASLKAGRLLSDYLSALNSNTERGTLCSEPLVLAVIQSLGALGDKIAFDSLLYVSYLPYGELVIEASRDALAGLKWQ